jgi:NAD(P)-dependent dehydrogenase (short-subunit alcohol dehydrogenase family)
MNIIINGGSKGIGKEIVINLASDLGNKILVTGRDEKQLTALTNIFNNVKVLACDISSYDSEKEYVKSIISGYFSEVNVLINMTGYLVSKDFINIETKDARKMMDTNFFGPAAAIKLIKPLMPSGSHIINISSMGGFQGSSKYKGLSYYSASKAAIGCLSECLATEFLDSGIRVNCLALGAVQTEMFSQAFPGYKAPVSAKEMSEFISWFAFNGQKYFNGKVIPVALGNP